MGVAWRCAQADAESAKRRAREGVDALLGSIRERYAVEQMYMEKVRRSATWWTAGYLGVHALSVMFVYYVLEPRKAARLREYVTDAFGKVRASEGASRPCQGLKAGPARTQPSRTASCTF